MNHHIKITTVVLMLLASLKHYSQNSTDNKPVINWDNGNITLFKDLGTVCIIPKKGSEIKNVKIWSIETIKGKLTYDKEGSLHDLMIGKIENITAGKNSRSLLYFDNENNPRIKSTSAFFFADDNTSDFYVSAKASDLVKKPEPENVIIEKSPKTVTVTEQKVINSDTLITPVLNPNNFSSSKNLNSNNFSSSTPSDTIVKQSGEIVLAKIISNSPTELRYKRIDNPDGPIYSINKHNSTLIVKYQNSIKVIFK